MADGRYCTSLRTLFTHFIDKMYLRADLETIETGIQHAVSIKINFTPVGCLQKTEPLIGKEFGDSAVGQLLMRFQNSTAPACIILSSDCDPRARCERCEPKTSCGRFGCGPVEQDGHRGQSGG